MSYTKRQLIEQINIRVSGGKLTQESTVKRIDIEFYLLAAVQAAWGMEFRDRQEKAIRAKRMGMPYEFTTFNELQISENYTPIKDPTNDLFYIKPNYIQTVGNEFNWNVAPTKGYEKIYKIKNRAELSGIADNSFMYAYYQQKPEQRIYIINLPQSCGVEFTSMQDLSAIGYDEIMPIPADKEVMVIDKAVEFFTGQKQAIEDVVSDQNDANNEREQKL